MMKTPIALLLFLMLGLGLNAQQKNYKPSISLMLQYADGDFKAVLGDKTGEEASLSSDIYSLKEQIGIGSEQIYKSKINANTFYTCTVSLLDASAILRDVLDYVNQKVKSGDFTGEDQTDGKGKNVTFVKNKAGEDVLKILTQYSNDNNADNDYFALVIFGKSARALK